jgi:hypothetical protein
MHDATNPNPPAATAAWLGAERLDVYRVAWNFSAWHPSWVIALRLRSVTSSIGRARRSC